MNKENISGEFSRVQEGVQTKNEIKISEMLKPTKIAPTAGATQLTFALSPVHPSQKTPMTKLGAAIMAPNSRCSGGG